MTTTTLLNIKTLSLDSFVEHYEQLVKRIAYHLAGRLPSYIAVQDLIQAGVLGLLEARENFDSDKGASFETFASLRIRGAMLDELRTGDWAPRSVHKAARMIATAIRKVEQATGRDAKDSEVASILEISLAEYQKMRQDIFAVRVLGFEEIGLEDDQIRRGLHAKLLAPHESVNKVAFKKALAQKIAELPERERLVIHLYYQEERTFKEIGEILGVTESRVCQIHSAAILRLKSCLKDWQ